MTDPISWLRYQWNDIKGNVKYGIIILAGGAMIALTRGLQWWQQFGLMVIFLGLVVWAVSAIIKAQNAEELVRNAPAPKQPAPKLPIEVSDIRQTFFSRGSRSTMTESDHGFQTIIMSFKNHTATVRGEQNVSFAGVTASLVFSGAGRREDITYGTWLDEYTRSVHFGPGEVRHLVVAWFERGGKRLMGLYNPKRINPLQGRLRPGISLKEPEIRVLPTSPCQVTVTLLSNETTLFHATYILTSTEDGTMELKKHETIT